MQPPELAASLAHNPELSGPLAEFFWSSASVDRLLPLGDGADKQSHASLNATLAYEELRSKLRDAAFDDEKVDLSHYFKKTFLEVVSVPTVLYVYSRVLIMHSWAWHLVLVLGRGARGRHAFLMC